MLDTGLKLKRPPISVFGEGTVVKRPRNDAHEKPRSSDDRTPNVKAISSGVRFAGSGFRVKPVSSPAGGQKAPRPPGLPLNQKEALAAFQATTALTTPARSKPQFHDPLRPPLPLPDTDTSFVEPQKKMTLFRARLAPPIVRMEKQGNLTTPLTSRVRPPDLRASTPKLTTSSRKVVPFHALPVPIPDESPAESPTMPLKPLPALKFDLGGRSRGKLMAMTTLETPTVELPEEKEVVGEAFELQRGLLVSPEKGGRKRGRFIRNGLAERAQLLMGRSSTAFTLWKKEIESSASRPGRLHEDLRLHVKNVVHVSRNVNVHSRTAGSLRSVLAVCDLPDGEERTVLFSFAPDGHDSHALSTGGLVAENVEVLVWRPWQETVRPPTLFCSRFLVLPSIS